MGLARVWTRQIHGASVAALIAPAAIMAALATLALSEWFGGKSAIAQAFSGPHLPPKSPTVVDRVVGAATSVTGHVPPSAGQLVTHVLESAGATADRLLPPGLGSSSTLSPKSLASGLHLP